MLQVLDGVVAVCAIILNPRARRRREREARLAVEGGGGGGGTDDQVHTLPASTEAIHASAIDPEKGVHAPEKDLHGTVPASATDVEEPTPIEPVQNIQSGGPHSLP